MSAARSWDAEAYDAVSSVQFESGRKLIDRRQWRGDEIVLDAGCGTGRLAVELLDRVPRGRVIAVDHDPAMVAEARKRLSREAPSAQVVEADVASLSGIEPVDVIYSNAVLHWIQDHDRVFATFFRHLKPGGELLIQCGGEGNLRQVRGACETIMRMPAFADPFRAWKNPWRYEDDASTEERLFIAGYEHAEVSLDPAPARFSDDASHEKFVRTVILPPYLDRLSTPALRESFAREYFARAAAGPNPRTLDYVRLTIRARRPPHA